MVKPKGFQTLTNVDEALRNWLNAWPTTKPAQVTLPVAEAYGRVLADDIVAPTDLPRFDRSAMDGYAVRHEDLTGASQVNPVKLKIVETDEVTVGQAKPVWTGNPVPKSANAVVMLEDIHLEGGIVEVYAPVSPGINISRHGEDVKQGQIIAKEGARLNPYHIGLAASLGFSELKVYRKPKISILATGNEVAAVGAKPVEHQVFDSNKITLSAMCKELGAETMNCGIARDDIVEISEKILFALREADALITTGGTSVGGLDLVPDAINRVGKPGVVAHGLALRPAMPTGVAVIDGKPVMILSGNPVASIIGFEVFGRPAVSRLLGLNKTEQRPTLKAVMARKVSTVLGRKTYVRVLVKLKAGELLVEPVSAKGPSNMSTMTQSNGYVVVPENREGLKEGESVMVQMFGNIEVESDVS